MTQNKLVHFQLLGLHVALAALDAAADAVGVGLRDGSGWFDTGAVGR